jgi:hypothetical protein
MNKQHTEKKAKKQVSTEAVQPVRGALKVKTQLRAGAKNVTHGPSK